MELRPSECVGILKAFHNQQFAYDSDEYNILLAVFPSLLTMMNKFSESPKHWFPDLSRKPSFVQFQNAGGFDKFGLNPDTFEEFLEALRICELESLDCDPFSDVCKFVAWSIDLQRRSKIFRLDRFQNDSYLSTFQLPVTKLVEKRSMLDKKSQEKLTNTGFSCKLPEIIGKYGCFISTTTKYWEIRVFRINYQEILGNMGIENKY